MLCELKVKKKKHGENKRLLKCICPKDFSNIKIKFQIKVTY